MDSWPIDKPATHEQEKRKRPALSRSRVPLVFIFDFPRATRARSRIAVLFPQSSVPSYSSCIEATNEKRLYPRKERNKQTMQQTPAGAAARTGPQHQHQHQQQCSTRFSQQRSTTNRDCTSAKHFRKERNKLCNRRQLRLRPERTGQQQQQQQNHHQQQRSTPT